MTFRTEPSLIYSGMIGQTRDACLLQNVGQKESKSEACGTICRSYVDPLGLFVLASPPLGSDRVSLSLTPGSLLVFCVSLSIRQSQAKIALKVSSEDEILELEALAKSLNLCARSIQDA
jgi:cytochrome c-type biogenesis protein CcmH/NrfF